MQYIYMYLFVVLERAINWIRLCLRLRLGKESKGGI